MSTDWKALCEELADTLERAQRALRFEGGCSDTTDNKRRALIARARAALAEGPVAAPAGPTDKAAIEGAAELIYTQAMEWAAGQPIPSGHISIPAWQQGGNSDAQEVARRTARDVLARYGHHFPDATKMVSQPAPPVEGEVGELVAALRSRDRWTQLTDAQADRAADLLEQRQAAPLPVAWMYRGEPNFDGREWQERWCVTTSQQVAEFEAQPDKPIPLFTALPLPQGEVQP